MLPPQDGVAITVSNFTTFIRRVVGSNIGQDNGFPS
jgi:hypothetical protein